MNFLLHITFNETKCQSLDVTKRGSWLNPASNALSCLRIFMFGTSYAFKLCIPLISSYNFMTGSRYMPMQFRVTPSASECVVDYTIMLYAYLKERLSRSKLDFTRGKHSEMK